MPRKPLLSQSDLETVFNRKQTGESLRKIAEDYPVTHQALSKRLKGFTPKVVMKVATPKKDVLKVSSDKIRSAYNMLSGGSARKTIAKDRDKLIAFLKTIEDDGSYSLPT